MKDIVEFWTFVGFLSLIVWPTLYVLVERSHINEWAEARQRAKEARWEAANTQARDALRRTPAQQTPRTTQSQTITEKKA